MIRLVFVVFGLMLCSFSLLAQEKEPALEISLLTCSSGNAIYAAYGHSAIRVIDHRKGKDWVFDYGVFDFDEPNFVLKFLRGNLKYKLAVRPFDRFMDAFVRQGRGVIEEKWNLSEKDRQEVYQFILKNYKPENRYYLYDFMYDNCSTRIRDLLESLETVEGPEQVELEPRTFRESIAGYLKGKEWMKFGIDLLFGQTVDQEMSFREEMFLPYQLSENLKPYRNTEMGIAVLAAPQELLPSRRSSVGGFNFFQPLIVFSILLVLLILVNNWKPNLISRLIPFFYFLAGLAGLFLLFMWFGTIHNCTKMNWDILWLNPIYLLLLGKKTWQPFRRRLVLLLIGINVLLLVTWPILPEALNPAAIPLFVILLVLNFKRLSSLRVTSGFGTT